MEHAARTRLVEARKERLWSQRDLANFLETTQNNISRWERGITTPGPYFRSKLCELFGKTPQELDLLTETNAVETQPNPTPDSSSLPPEQPLPLWHVPYMRNPFFTGRENVLDRLHSVLKHEHSALLSQSYALSGLGGIGKTQTAIEYAHRYADEYVALFWISAETTENILSSFVAIANVLNLPEKEEREQERVASAVIRWLNAHNRWLLIFDNVEEMELVQGFLPTARTGSLLFTSRKQALGITAQTLDLEKMTPEEGTRFLLYRARLLDPTASHKQLAPTDEAAIQEIVSLMDGLPLALDQAGAYIEATRCSLSDYLQLLQSSPQHLLDEREDHANHPLSVSKTFTLAFERLAQSNALAAELLTVCAFLAPEVIPEEFFTEGATQLGPTFETLAADPLQFQAALKALLTYSLIQRDAMTHTLTVHRLVQAVFREKMSSTKQEMWQERILLALEITFPEISMMDSPATWNQCERLLAQALWTLQHAGAAVQTLEEATLAYKVARYLQIRGRYREAQPLFWQALHIRERCLGTDHPEVAVVLTEIAYLSYVQGSYGQAELLYLQAVALLEQESGCSNLGLIRALNNLALLYQAQEKYNQAETLQRRAMHIEIQQYGPEHPRVASSLGNLAMFASDQGHFSEAEDLYLKALHIFEQHLGEEHPQVGLALNNLADVYLAQGRLSQAEPLLQRALHLFKQALGERHPDVAYPLTNLADLYLAQGQYAKVAPLYQQALSIWEQALGETHPNVAYVLQGLASLSQKQGALQEAQALYQRALAIREQTQGQEHGQVAEILNRLAIVYLEQENYAEAEPLFQRALRIMEKPLEAEHHLLAEPLQGLAQIYTEQGKYEQAGPLYQRALVLRRQNLGPEHPSVAETLHHLARFHQLQQQNVEALSLYQQALVLLEQTFGLSHPKTVKTRAAYEALLREMGCVEGAQAAISSMPGTLEKEPLSCYTNQKAR